MLLIKSPQLRQLTQSSKGEFINRLQKLIEAEYPEEILLEDNSKVRQRLIKLIDKAYRFNYVLEQHVAMFVCFCLELGDDFDQTSEYKSLVELLHNEQLSVQTRIDQVGEQIFS